MRRLLNNCSYTLWLGFITLLLGGAPPLMAAEVSLAVAANFTDVTKTLLPRFTSLTGHRAKPSFGSTGKLYAQIENGAPFEVFLAADQERPRRAEAEGLAVAGSRFTYAQGRLALWSATEDLTLDASTLTDASVRHIAIANPKTAPYGLAAQQVLHSLGLWDRLERRLVRGDSIAQTFQFVVSGNAQLGFVALSQVKAWQDGEAGSLWLVPQEDYAPIAQQAVLLQRGAANPAARAWLDFLRGDAARAIILDFGYGLAASAATETP